MPLLRPTPRAQVLLAILLLLTSTYLIASYPSTPAFPTFKAEPEFKYHSDAVGGEPKKVAIIGAGASGGSAAWFLSRAGRVMKERTGREAIGEITVFERDERVGGRESRSRFVLRGTDQKELLLYTLMEMRDYEHRRLGLVSLSTRIGI
jgi:NADPH-dependent 2,4-dienoyl-CoA reductase/sulfur reductase-like enzyme